MYKVELKSDGKSSSAFSNVPQDKLFSEFSRVIFMLHGFPDNNTSFEKVWPIVERGVKAKKEKVLLLAPAMRGYERLNQRDFSQYRTSDLARDVYKWVEFLQMKGKPVHLFGHDWGAIASFKAASMYPDVITSIVTLAIPYLSNVHLWDFLWWFPIQIYLLSYFLTMQWSRWYNKMYTSKYLDELWQYWSPGWKYRADEIESVRSTLTSNGVLDHATAYYRCLFNPMNIRDVRWHVDFNKVPTMMVGGEKDQCQSVKIYEFEKRKLAGNPNVRVEVVPGVGHFLHRENPEKVGELAVEWFTR